MDTEVSLALESDRPEYPLTLPHTSCRSYTNDQLAVLELMLVHDCVLICPLQNEEKENKSALSQRENRQKHQPPTPNACRPSIELICEIPAASWSLPRQP